MEKNFNTLLNNLNTCLEPTIPDIWTRDYYIPSQNIRKITDIFNNKNDTEIRNIIELLMNAQEKFYMNRSKILAGDPSPGPHYYGNDPGRIAQRTYLENAVLKSIEYQSIEDAYMYPINYVYNKHIHMMYGDVLSATNFIDTVPKYLECHIELYENILRLRYKKPIMSLSEIRKVQEEEKQREDPQVKEEYETLREDPRVKEEEETIQGFISGGKKNKKNKSRKNKSRKNKGKKNKSRKNKSKKTTSSNKFRI
jgi:hypothetical protein